MTIAQQIKWDFEVYGELVIKDKNGKQIYFENSSGMIIDNRPKSSKNKVVEWILGKVGIRF
jgi:hypothetical protein